MTDLVWCELHGSTVIKTNFKPLLSCHLFGAHFVCNGEYYSLVLENAQELKISKESRHVSLLKTIICPLGHILFVRSAPEGSKNLKQLSKKLQI